MPTIDWDAVYEEAGDFNAPMELVPAGKHRAVIDSAEWKETSTGKAMLVVFFRVLAGEGKNRKVRNNHVIDLGGSSVALGINLRQLEVYGLNQALLKALSEDEQIERIVGNEVEITVIHKPDQAEPTKIYANIQDVRSVEGGAKKASGPPKGGSLPKPRAKADGEAPSGPPPAPFSKD